MQNEEEQSELFAKLDFYQRLVDHTMRFINEVDLLSEYREYMDEEGDIQFELDE